MPPPKPGIAFATLAMIGAPMLLGGCFESGDPPRCKPPAACFSGVSTAPRHHPANADTKEPANVTIYTNTTILYDDTIPLSLQAHDMKNPLRVMAMLMSASPTSAFFYRASTGQPFHVEGTITLAKAQHTSEP